MDAPRQREAHARLFGVLSRVLGELDAGAAGERREQLLAEAFAALVEFDRWVPAGERARWRAQLRRSHRWAWLPTAALAIGLSAAGVFGTPVLGGPALFTPGFVGYLVGLAVVGPWWGYLERRVLAQVSLTLTGVGFGVFALSGAVPGLAMVAAVLLGFAGAGYSPVQSRAGEWVRETTEARRANGESVRLLGGVTALVTLGFATVASVIFVVLKPLLGVSPMAAGLFGVGLSVVAVAGLRWAMPGELPDRERAQIKRSSTPVRTVVATTIKFVGDAVSTLRQQYPDVGRLVALVAVVMGAANLVSGASDAFWRKGLAQSAGSDSLLNVLSFSLVGSGVLLALVLVPGEVLGSLSDRTRARLRVLARVGVVGVAVAGVTALTGSLLFGVAAGGVVAAGLLVRALRGPGGGGVPGGAGKQDLLTGRPGLFLLLMAGALTGGVVTAAVTAVTGNPLIGIAVGVYGTAVSVTGMGLGVNAILDRYVPESQRASALTAINLLRALGNIAGAQLAGASFAGATPLLPAGWTGVVVQNLVPGAVVLGAAVLLWRRTVAGLSSPSTPQQPSTPGRLGRLVARLGPVSRARLLGYVAAGVVAAGAGVAAGLLLFSGPVGVVAAVVAGLVSPVLLMLLHHVWAHGPPWARSVLKVVAVLAVTAVILTLAGSSASAATGTPGEPAQGTRSDADGLLLLAGVAAAVVLWVAERKAESARRLMARVGSFVVGGLLGFVVAVAFGGWAGLAVGLVLVAPELLALAFAVIPELLGRQPVEWLRAAAASWLAHGPPVWARIGFLAGALWLLRCGECAAGMAMVLPPLGGGKGGAGRAAPDEPLLLSELGTNRAEIQQLTRRKQLWNGFMRAVKWYEAQRAEAEKWPALVDLRARLEFALAAARARRDQPGSGGAASTASADSSLRRVLHGVAAADPVVTLPQLAGDLNWPKDRVTAGLRELEELGLVRLALTPTPIVAQITELGEAVLADPAAVFLAVERLDDQRRVALRRRVDVIAARIRPARTHVGPDLRFRREQRSSRAGRKPPPDASPDRSPGGPLGLLSDEEIELAQQAFAAVRAASVGTPENTAHQVRIRGPPPALRPGEELFSPTPEAVAAALRELDASPQQVARILRAWAFSWPDADGTVVFAVFADRLAELQRLGLLERVLRHERDDVAGRFAGKHEHDRDVAAVWQAIREAQASVPGPALALLDELPAGRAADDGLRRTRLEEWDPEFLREIAAGSVEDALWAVLDAQGMGGPPTPVDAADWRELVAAGHQPMYRGFRGEQAREEDEQFRSGERPVLGLAANMRGTGSNFSTDPATAGRYARIVSLPNPFRPLRRRPPAEVVLIGYMHRDAVVLGFSEAYQRQQPDVAAARARGEHRLAELLADLGVWAALHGIDAVYQETGRFDRHYLVLNRGAMLVETAESMAELAGRERDWSGDGLVPCRCGDEHFGIHGGASLLLVHRAPDGTVRVLMQRRSAAVQHSGTWALPGGARGLREPPQRTAMREAWEETGLDPSTYTVRDVHVDDHGDWSHTTVLAETDSLVTPGALSPEVAEAAWVRLDDPATLALHPGFAASWPAVSAALLGDVGSGTRATSPGATPDTAGDPALAPDPGATPRAAPPVRNRPHGPAARCAGRARPARRGHGRGHRRGRRRGLARRDRRGGPAARPVGVAGADHRGSRRPGHPPGCRRAHGGAAPLPRFRPRRRPAGGQARRAERPRLDQQP